MKVIELLSGDLNVPLAIVSNVNFGKAGNIIETRKNVFRCRGFGCRELSISFSITPNVASLFSEVNSSMNDWGFMDICDYFMNLEPELSVEPFHVYLADVAICSELKFSITSITKTAQSDFNGVLQQLDISMTLSGVSCSKAASRTVPVSYDDSETIPSVTITCKGKTFNCREVCNITRFIITPSALDLELKMGNSRSETSSDAWIYTVAQDDDAFITVDGFGVFYVKNASFDGDFISYECSIFSKASEETITKTIIDSDINDVFDALKIDCNNHAENIDVSNYTLNGSSIDIIQQLAENLGFMIGFRMNQVHVFDAKSLSNAIADASASLNYFADVDVVSEKTSKITFRDAVHEYVFDSGGSGSNYVMNSSVCTKTDRTREIFEKINIMSNNIDLTIPFDPRIKHYSLVNLSYQNISRTVIVTDYAIDMLENTIALRCSYSNRGGNT